MVSNYLDIIDNMGCVILMFLYNIFVSYIVIVVYEGVIIFCIFNVYVLGIIR